ncbi:MAG: putative Ig domain-containing protein [Bacillota bacterium]
MGRRILLVLSVFLAVSVLLGCGSFPAHAAGEVSFSLIPSTREVCAGDIFAVEVRIDATSQAIYNTEAYIDFDPGCLRVVNDSGGEVSQIEAGSVLPQVGENTVNNTNGQINYAAGTTGSAVNSSFVLAGIRFKALTPASITTIAFSTTASRKTTAFSADDNSDVTGSLSPTEVSIKICITSPDVLPEAAVGVPYSYILAAAGATSWSITNGSLPGGLNLEGATGQIFGNPSASGSFNFTVQASGSGSIDHKTFTLTVVPALEINTTLLPDGNVGQPYSVELEACGGTMPYAWSATSALPQGLAIYSGSNNKGLLNGTPGQAGTYIFTVKVTDIASRFAEKSFTMTVRVQLSISPATLPIATKGAAYSTTLSTSGGTAPYTWSVSSGALPAGLNLNASTTASCSISGTPTGISDATFTIRVSDSTGKTGVKEYTISVTDRMAINPTSLPPASKGQYYSDTLTVSGGKSPFTWTLKSGSLPDGLSLNGVTTSACIIYGTPTGTSDKTFTIKVTDSDGRYVERSYTISVAEKMTVTTGTLPSATKGTSYSVTLAASGGKTPYNWKIQSGTLPAGITLTSSTGKISGTPTGNSDTTFTVRVTDKDGRYAEKSFTIEFSGSQPTITTTTLPPATKGSFYNTTIAASGGATPYTWSLKSGSLPGGLTLNTGTGKISGTPAGNGDYTFAVQVKDNAERKAEKSFTMKVAASPLTIKTASLPAAASGISYAEVITAEGGIPPYTWSLAKGSLPPGLKLKTDAGAVYGTPSRSGSFTFTVRVTDSGGRSADKGYTITVSSGVQPAPVVFADVRDSWMVEAVSRLSEDGIISGYPDGTFRPNNTITRAEVASILSRALNLAHGETRELNFSDNPRIPEWVKGAVAAAVKEGLIAGYPNADGTVAFEAGRTVSRTEMAVLTARILEKKLGSINPAQLNFTDAGTIPSWARNMVGKAVAKNVVGGYPDNTFRGGRSVTRAEAASMIVRLLDLI